MKTRKHSKNQAILFFFDELTNEQKTRFEDHLEGCEICRNELAQLRKMASGLRARPEWSPTDKLTGRFHDRVMTRVKNRQQVSLTRRIGRWIGSVRDGFGAVFSRPRYQLAGAVSVFLLGILVGKLWLSRDILTDPKMLLDFAEHQRKLSQIEEEDLQRILANYLIQMGRLNVEDLEHSGTGEGKVSVNFDTDYDFSISGDITDASIQNMILYSLLKDDNPGQRLRAVKMLETVKYNQDIREVLNSVVVSDPNDGIRLRVARILGSMPHHPSTTQVFMKALLNEPNSGIRIEILNAFKKWQDPATIPVLALASSQDENEYIQQNAKDLLMELSNTRSDAE